MELQPNDINTIKKWYLDLWQDFIEADKNYQSWKQRRDELETKLNIVRPVLSKAEISTTDLEQKARTALESTEEVVVSASWTRQVVPIFQLQKQPVHYTHIIKTLKDKGYDVPGEDPRNTLLAYLSRHKKLFAKAPELGRGYYKLKE